MNFFNLILLSIWTSSSFISLNAFTLIIQKGNIVDAPTEAIVNAANKELKGLAGVCGAIFNAAGWDDLQKACNRYNGCPTGEARITDSFNLKYQGNKTIQSIIHAVGPDCNSIKDTKEQDRLLKNAYKNSLLLADQKKIRSVAFPFISSAIYAFPKERAARIALETIDAYAKLMPTHIETVHIVLFSQEDYELFLKLYKA